MRGCGMWRVRRARHLDGGGGGQTCSSKTVEHAALCPGHLQSARANPTTRRDTTVAQRRSAPSASRGVRTEVGVPLFDTSRGCSRAPTRPLTTKAEHAFSDTLWAARTRSEPAAFLATGEVHSWISQSF